MSDEVMRLVDVLDGFNRYRFSGDADLLAEWESRAARGGGAAGEGAGEGTPASRRRRRGRSSRRREPG